MNRRPRFASMAHNDALTSAACLGKFSVKITLAY